MEAVLTAAVAGATPPVAGGATMTAGIDYVCDSIVFAARSLSMLSVVTLTISKIWGEDFPNEEETVRG